ncbi:FAS1 domain-containing protein [Hyaloraphidium curvatum]|nr:FAS1 domain-containing protein [Hyaloraphidium curvatum]
MKFAAFVASALFALGAASSAEAATAVETLLGIASGNISKPYNLSTLVGLGLQFPDVLPLLVRGNTLFAPTDAAFADALTNVPAQLAAANITDVNLTSPAVLNGILKFHVYGPFAGGQALIPSFLNSSDPSKLTTQNPQRSFVDYSNGVEIKNNLYPAATVVDFIPTDTAQINVVDSVVLPPLCPTDTARLGGPEFAGLLQAITSQNLSSVVDTLPNATIFAPTTEAFATALASLQASGVNVTNELIQAVLSYHVVPAVAFSTELPAGNFSLPTLLTNQSLAVSNTDSGVVVGTAPYNARVIQPNIGTCNGVIHVIDAVLIPPGFLGGTTATATATATVVPTATGTGSATASAVTSAASTTVSAAGTSTTAAASTVTTAAPTTVATTSRPASAGRIGGGVAAAGFAAVLAAVAAF